ncbi:MAG: hypothetical protein JXR88_11420 [Clostridia bacterium]|nr:hypothetical protein [Clostridia bacterium]
MKLLARENELCPLMLGEEILLSEQRKAMYDLYLYGYIREMYEKEGSNEMILIMECSSKRECENYLAKLPLVRAGKSTFNIEVLSPYRGFKEII